MRNQMWWMILPVLSACGLDSGDGGNRGGTGAGIGGIGGVLDGGGPRDAGAGFGGAAGLSGAGGFGGVGGFADSGTIDSGSSSGVCGLPFDPGPCEALFPVIAFVPALGGCYPHIYGGCEGNGNRFDSVHECEATCPFDISGNGCPPNRVLTEICVECGPAGGCANSTSACAPLCSSDGDCPVTSAGGVTCFNGACRPFPCD